MEYLRKPWKHQQTAIDKAKAVRDFALFMEMGTGKTLAAINIARHKYAESGVLRTLVLCPPVVISNWKEEWLANSKLEAKHIVCLGAKARKKYQPQTVHKVLVTNYEALLNKDFYAKLEAWAPQLIIYDESHKLKNPSSKRSKQCYKLTGNALHRYILTGTPILNDPMDAFGQFLVLDNGETFGKSFWAFRNKYFYDKNAGMPKHVHFPDWKIRPSAEAEISKLISDRSYRVKKLDCMDLPPLVQTTLFVDMAPEQKRMYDQMKKSLVAYLDDKACIASIALTKSLRLLQIASGFVSLEGDNENEERHFKKNPKDEALESILESAVGGGQKVIVWASFRRNYDSIRAVCQKMGVKSVELHGAVNQKAKDSAIHDFQRDPDTKVLIGHPASGGIGINLINSENNATVTVFYSRTYSLVDDLQAEARNHRGGAESYDKITRIDLVCRDTVDEFVLKALSDKVDMSERILEIGKYL